MGACLSRRAAPKSARVDYKTYRLSPNSDWLPQYDSENEEKISDSARVLAEPQQRDIRDDKSRSSGDPSESKADDRVEEASDDVGRFSRIECLMPFRMKTFPSTQSNIIVLGADQLPREPRWEVFDGGPAPGSVEPQPGCMRRQKSARFFASGSKRQSQRTISDLSTDLPRMSELDLNSDLCQNAFDDRLLQSNSNLLAVDGLQLISHNKVSEVYVFLVIVALLARGICANL